MNKQSGNMYEDISHTSNPIKGDCVFDCYYCSMKGINRRYRTNHPAIAVAATNLFSYGLGLLAVPYFIPSAFI